MAVVRRNILTNATARQKYIQGVTLLKAEGSGTTTNSLGIPGPGKELSSYDLFVVMHHWAMNTFTPATQMDRNAAHRGPVFLPWHRWMLIQLDAQLQRVLNDATFGLPFWNWAADGEKPKAQQPNSALWKPNCMGGDGTGVNGAVRQKQRPAEPYKPPQSAPQALFRHRLDDPMYSIFAAGTNGPHPQQMLNVSSVYSYGSLAVA